MDLGEGRHDGEPQAVERRLQAQPRDEPVGMAVRPAAADEIAVEHLLGDLGDGEVRQRLAQLSVAVTVLESSRQH